MTVIDYSIVSFKNMYYDTPVPLLDWVIYPEMHLIRRLNDRINWRLY